MCNENALYQLQLPDLSLITTQNACLYKDRGLNETLTFFTDNMGKNLISFSYNVSNALHKTMRFKKQPLFDKVLTPLLY